MASVFRNQKKIYTLREFYESDVNLPVIIYIEEGFKGSNNVETIGPAQYFFIHAVYKQKRVMTRGHVPAVCTDKCLLSIPVTYPIKFRRVESRLDVGSEEFMWSLLRKYDPPFQVQMSRTDGRSLSVGLTSTTTSNISNLLVMRKYKEIYLLGNLLDQGNGALYYKHVTAIPLYMQEVKVRLVDGFSKGMAGQFALYMDELYAFALQNIDLRGNHGNRDISITMEKTNTFAKSQMCEYLEPDRYIALQWPKVPKESAESNFRQSYKPNLGYSNSTCSLEPTAFRTEKRLRQLEEIKLAEGHDEITKVFTQDYTPLDDIRDLKRPVSVPEQRKYLEPTAPPKEEMPPGLPPRYQTALPVVAKGTEKSKNSSSEKNPTEDDDDIHEDEMKYFTSIPFYDKNRTGIQMKLSKELMKVCERRKEPEKEDKMTSYNHIEPEVDYDMLPSGRQPKSCVGQNKVHSAGIHRGNVPDVTYETRNDHGEKQTRMNFDPQMAFARMTVDDVVELLRRLNLDKYEAVFRTDMVDGFMLSDLTESDLRDSFGFTSVESKRLMNFILHRHLPKMM
ncbi:uncharacterized protein LOC132565141 [Ylistrum balloti]|uniref:uncharacterized protein LOC132565141 n=1 Tax=Ylistrum balloti TaxID=509963 RepID=UPI002905D8A3|nr:uncharacterized protein LOC132565141 [Ylistrum balloti]